MLSGQGAPHSTLFFCTQNGTALGSAFHLNMPFAKIATECGAREKTILNRTAWGRVREEIS